MKILLINPPRIYYQGSKGLRFGLPLGLLYLAAVLEKNGYQPKILDCLISPKSEIADLNGKTIHGLPDNLILEKITVEKPDLIGITNPFTSQIDSAIHIAGLAKGFDKNIVTVIGGPHLAVDGKNLLEKNQCLDIGVRGEGELIFLELVKKIEKSQPISDIKSIYCRNNSGAVVENDFGGFINNLDDLPYPAYHLIDLDLYFDLIEKGLKIRPQTQKRSISMITSRGCPYNCIFCSIHLHMGKMFRAHSPAYVINHIKYAAEEYGVKHISFEDDNFSLDLNRAKTILRGIIDNRLKITWDTPNGVRADRVDGEFIQLVKKSGGRELVFGLESGSQRVLDKIIEKNLKLDEAIESIKLCQKNHIKTRAFFVIGFPGETKEEINQTKDFSLMIRRQYGVESSPLIATPLIGTRLYQICKEQGYLIKEPDPASLSVATQPQGQGLIKTEEFDPEYLKSIAAEIAQEKAKIHFKEKLFKPSTYWSSLKFIISHPKKVWHYFLK